MLVGTRNGTITEFDLSSEDSKVLMQGHHTGEAWGLDVFDGCVVTSGDDNRIMVWDPANRVATDSTIVNPEERGAKKNKASSQSDLPASQQSRAIAFNPTLNHIAAGANDGSITVRSLYDIQIIAHELTNSKQWIEALEFSPCGKYLAAGSHDNYIYIYDAEADYDQVAKLKGHTAAVTNIDWAMDSSYIRSVCIGYELLFFNIGDMEQDTSGASNTTGTLWSSQHCKFGWNVDGIFPKETSGDHINCVDMSQDQALIATGDDFGLVNIFRNPARKGVPAKSYLAHSEHVMRVKFGKGDFADRIFSIGGQDQTLLQWKMC